MKTFFATLVLGSNKDDMRAIYSTVGRDNLFPSALTAFCSGAVGNISYQSCNAVYRAIRANKDAVLKQSVTCSLNNVVYAGIVTASYMGFSFLCPYNLVTSRRCIAETLAFMLTCIKGI